MDEVEIDYAALERGLNENKAALGPGVRCGPCTSNGGVLFYKGVYHPKGREQRCDMYLQVSTPDRSDRWT